MNKTLLVMFLAVFSTSISAQWREYEYSDYTVSLPKAWDKTRLKKEGTFIATEPHRDVMLVFMTPSPELRGIDGMTDVILQEISRWVNEVTIGELREYNQNELDVFYIPGEGQLQGDDAHVKFYVHLFHRDGDFLLLLTLTTKEVERNYTKTLKKIYESIKREQKEDALEK